MALSRGSRASRGRRRGVVAAPFCTFMIAGLLAASTAAGPPIVRQLAGGGYSAYALASNGAVWAWGDDLEGQLGNGTDFSASDVPVRVLHLSGAVAVAASANSAYALRSNGTVWAWGDDGQGELGNGQETYTSELPTRVQRLSHVTYIAAGDFSVYALCRDGTVWAWGDNAFGQLGGSAGVTGSDSPVEVAGLTGVEQLAAGASTAYALTGDGTVWAWGDNAFGELARRGAPLASTVPVKITQLTEVSAIAASAYAGFALRRDGTVWAWGDDGRGELGTGQCKLAGSVGCPSSSLPLRVLRLSHVIALSAGTYSTYALEADGTVWAWGYDAYGQLGNGGTLSSDVPVRVEGLHHVIAIASGGNAAYALEADGTVWAWGYGAYGQLGNGGASSSDVPVQVELPATVLRQPNFWFGA